MSDMPFVSVIIPVYNDRQRLRLCLEALERQSYPSARYEVIVVDNNSTEDIAEAVRPFRHVSVEREAQPGSYAARNTGLRRAQGEILAFTDSDCIPAEDWIERGVGRLQSTPKVGLIAGRVDIFYRNPARPTAVELYERVTAFPQQKFITKYHFGATANVFTFRHVMDAVGLFNAALASGGDREWGQRVHAAGYKLLYADDVCVAHPARHALGELYRKSLRTAGGLQDLAARPSSVRFAKSVIKDIIAPWKDIAPILRDTRLSSAAQRAKAIAMTFCIRYMQIWVRAQYQFGNPARAR